jgi:YhcH/YjgK/YiaL family protein
MILDRLENWAPYAKLGRRFTAGFTYLRETDLEKLADGRYEIDGPRVVAIVQAYATKPRPDGRWEGHRDHADIQYLVRGVERMGVTPIATVASEAPYDPGADLEFYAESDAGAAPAGRFFDLAAGEFALFFPHDVHMPGLAVGAPREVKKVVIKVKLE